MAKPSPTNYPGYFQRYIDLVPESELITALKNQTAGMRDFLHGISEQKSMHAYAAGKWTIKEMLQHIIDAERIFCFRALCFARGEKQNLPGFDEDEYAAAAHANSRTWQSLVEEMMAVRKATEMLFENLSNEALAATGTANNNLSSVSSIGFTLTGHYYHHKKVLLERYL